MIWVKSGSSSRADGDGHGNDNCKHSLKVDMEREINRGFLTGVGWTMAKHEWGTCREFLGGLLGSIGRCSN